MCGLGVYRPYEDEDPYLGRLFRIIGSFRMVGRRGSIKHFLLSGFSNKDKSELSLKITNLGGVYHDTEVGYLIPSIQELKLVYTYCQCLFLLVAPLIFLTLYVNSALSLH